MVNREQLISGGLRAYELGRLRAAARAALYVVPLVVACAFETGARRACGCLGVLLLGAAVFLRWRSRAGGESVTAGLLAGGLPLLAALVVARVAPECANAPLVSICTALCLAVGVPAGVWLALRVVQRQAGAAGWLSAAGIAAVAASVGCIGLGVGAVVGAAVGLVAGSGIGALTAKTAP